MSTYYAVIAKHKTDPAKDFLLSIHFFSAKAEEYRDSQASSWALRDMQVVVRTVKQPILEEIDDGYYEDHPESHGIFN